MKTGDLVKGLACQPRTGEFEWLEGELSDGLCSPGKSWVRVNGGDRLAWTCTLELIAMKSEEKTVRARVLDEAKRITATDRNSAYGEPEDNFQRIADYWNVWLQDRLKEGAKITPGDTAAMMIFVKMAREMNAPKEDNKVDGAGYFACWAEVDVDKL